MFAEAIGVDVAHVAKAPLSSDLALEDARAMLRAVGPALIDLAVDSTAALSSIDEEDVIEFFAESIVARGPLPPVRFGKNPYGVLPIVDLASLVPLASDSADEKKIETFVRDLARIGIATARLAASSLPVIAPGDQDAGRRSSRRSSSRIRFRGASKLGAPAPPTRSRSAARM